MHGQLVEDDRTFLILSAFSFGSQNSKKQCIPDTYQFTRFRTYCTNNLESKTKRGLLATFAFGEFAVCEEDDKGAFKPRTHSWRQIELALSQRLTHRSLHCIHLDFEDTTVPFFQEDKSLLGFHGSKDRDSMGHQWTAVSWPLNFTSLHPAAMSPVIIGSATISWRLGRMLWRLGSLPPISHEALCSATCSLFIRLTVPPQWGLWLSPPTSDGS